MRTPDASGLDGARAGAGRSGGRDMGELTSDPERPPKPNTQQRLAPDNLACPNLHTRETRRDNPQKGTDRGSAKPDFCILQVYYVKNPVDFGAGLRTIKRVSEPNYRREICHSVRGVSCRREKNRPQIRCGRHFYPPKTAPRRPGCEPFFGAARR